MNAEESMQWLVDQQPGQFGSTDYMGLFTAFRAWFSGGLSEGWTHPGGGLFLGKAECEWVGLEGWAKIGESGLMDVCVEPRGDERKTIRIEPTDLGWEAIELYRKGWNPEVRST